MKPLDPEESPDFSGSSPGVVKSLSDRVGAISTVILRDTATGESPSPVIEPSSPEMPADHLRSERLQLFGEIGRGGFGAVLKGRDTDLGRDLAVKVLLEVHKDRPDFVHRFVGEAQIGGQLQHPNIVPVYELGTFKDNRPYFAMKLVKGRTLSELLRERPSPDHELAKFLGIFEHVCQAMAYAHVRGVIHRDLKPANVMVGAFGEVQVMDWGLAKVLLRGGDGNDAFAGIEPPPVEEETVVATTRNGSDYSEAGTVKGTWQYMAPEQANGEIDSVDERADVFALGSILCEILTGRPVYIGRNFEEILRKAKRGQTAEALIRLEATKADEDLLALADQSLAVEPLDRLRDAGVVSERISAYLASVQKRLREAELGRVKAQTQAVEERKRRKLQVGLAVLIFILAASGGLLGFSTYTQRQDRIAKVDARFGDVKLLMEQAREHAEDPARWIAARERLAGIKGDVDNLADPEITRAFQAFQNETHDCMAAAQRDQDLLSQLSGIRSSRVDVGAEGTDLAYKKAFLDAGIDIDGASKEKLTSLLEHRPKATLSAMAPYLDHWVQIRGELGKPELDWSKPLAAARISDPDPFRNEIRETLTIKDEELRRNKLEILAKHQSVSQLSPATALLLASRLSADKVSSESVALLRESVSRHPDDLWGNYELAYWLTELTPPANEEAVRFYTAARALRPTTAHNLGHLLEDMKRPDEAIAVFRDLVNRQPEEGLYRQDLGALLETSGQTEEANWQFDQAIVYLRKRLNKDPDDVKRRLILGDALKNRDQIDTAFEEYRLAAKRKPNNASAHLRLGNAFLHKNEIDAAIEEYRLAIKIEPDRADAHNNLGYALDEKHETESAIEEYRLALKFQPDDAEAHNNLGLSLSRKNQFHDAIEEYRKAVKIEPDFARAYCNLGLSLQSVGKYSEALTQLRKGHEIGSKQKDWRFPSENWIKTCEFRVALLNKLTMIIKGNQTPADNQERLDLAKIAYSTKQFVVSAKLYEEALIVDSSLTSNRDKEIPYQAACSASLAASNVEKAVDDPAVDEADRAAFRSKALKWLQGELREWERVVQTKQAGSENRDMGLQTLTYWKEDADLASIRDPEAIAKLPESEREGFTKLWADVDKVLGSVSDSGGR